MGYPMSRYDNLKARARAATSGPWCEGESPFRSWVIDAKGILLAEVGEPTDQAFMAAASPSVVLEMIERIENLEWILEELRK